ncbi:amino acid adenylation domain-containing protein [Aliikangiella marina]|uniref:Amino acid adenylation domain-containing protein n=1 Tax=Aliikangiella marina TaxID=1712262 RepID=A0A545TJG2_9GAMM|nr:non-ribosomal peptide synthetase [Aliikangiella marina]TQV77372.1 amino acid adenylation domain-containing protein [Aliikangiella marina]
MNLKNSNLFQDYLSQLADVEPVDLLIDKQEFIKKRELVSSKVVITGSTDSNLEAFVTGTRTSKFSVFLSAYYIVLAAITGQQKLSIGIDKASVSDVNTNFNPKIENDLIPWPMDIDFSRPLIDIVTQVHCFEQSIIDTQVLDVSDLKSELNKKVKQNYDSLISASFSYRASPKCLEPNTDVPNSSLYKNSTVSIEVVERQQSFYISFDIDQQLSKRYQHNKIPELYQLVVNNIIGSERLLVEEIDFVSQDEKYKQLIDWNQTYRAFESELTLTQVFERQVRETPQAPAVLDNAQSLTYEELQFKVIELASVIQQRIHHNKQSIKADTLIALYLDRSVETIVAMLAVLKVGAAYVPISPEFPVKRTQFVLTDTQSALVISQECHRVKLNQFIQPLAIQPAVLYLDEVRQHRNQAIENFTPAKSSDLASVIYTSGTTGNPKGVMVEHASIINLIFSQSEKMKFEQQERVLWLADYIFDASIEQAFLALLNGAELHIATRAEILDAEQIRDKIVAHQITHLHATPSYLSVLGEIKAATSLRRVLAGGESGIGVLKAIWGDLLVNEYGPTETTVTSIESFDYSQHPLLNCIGKPIANTQVYVLSDNLKLLPIGAPGELYIGGAGVARGYLNQAQLTQEKFIENPYASEADKARGYTRLYKTGDVVRWLADGNLEFLGRNDGQVKIRGYRIELGEIESAINNLSGIKQCVVVACEHHENEFLAAYVVAVGEECLSIDTLKDELRTFLPDYMLPSTLTYLDKIPLTINGKLDQRALPAPVLVEQNNYVAPRNQLETKLCEIWQNLLGVTQVGINDNYFAIGGNSIIAMRLTAITRKELNIDIPLSLLFTYKTIAGITEHLKDNAFENIPSASQLHKHARSPVSFAQERLLFIEQYEQGTSAYHIPNLFELSTDVRLDVLTRTIDYLIQRHPILRTVYFTSPEGDSYQQVIEQSFNLNKAQCRDENELLTQVSSEIERPFDLSREISLRVNLYVVEDKHYLLMVWHHIAVDGWSLDLLMQELSSVYRAFCEDRDPALPDLEINYIDYSIWQKQSLRGETLKHLEDYWQSQLSGFETLELPTDYPRPKELSYLGEDYQFELDEELTAQIRQQARLHETTVYSVLLSAFYITLATMSGQEDIIVGTPTDNRQHPQTQNLVGLLANTLALRVSVDSNETISQLIRQVHQTVMQAKIHQELSFERLVDLLDIQRDPSRVPFVDVMFSLQSPSDLSNEPFKSNDLIGKFNLYTPAKVPLSLFIYESSNKFECRLNAAVDYYSISSTKCFASIFQNVVNSTMINSSNKIKSCKFVTQDEQYKQLIDWNQTYRAFESELTLTQVFERQVRETPQAPAVLDNAQSLTYEELQFKVIELASVIQQRIHHNKQSIKADTLIALYLDRSVETIVAMLAVLKVGAAYVPISPEFPVKRTQFVLTDTQSALVISQECHRVKLNQFIQPLAIQPAVLYLDEVRQHRNQAIENFTPAKSSDLASVIYTSGTTGNPKGVMVEHASIINLIFSQSEKMKFEQQERVLWLADYIFDASIEQAFLALLNGAELHIATRAEILDAEQIRDKIVAHQITHLHATPSYLSVLGEIKAATSLRRVLAGGESGIGVLKAIWGDLLVNEYGPTETTVTSIESFDYSQHPLLNCIGKPIANTQVYVLSDNLKLLPIGAPGELYIGGAGVARGYLNQAQLTQEKFIENPYASEADKARGYTRLYKTGDVVRWLADGNLEFLGRNDGQVKIRGYRIELGEIESAINNLSGIKQCVVVACEHHENEFLAAYVVAVGEECLSIDTLKDELRTFLPDYMLPSTLTYLDKIPLTINGKLDQRALPAPVLVEQNNYVAPRNQLETKLCEIWQNLLGVTQVGINDNYFAIGGNSIIAMRLTAITRKELNIDIPLSLLFTYKTIAGITEHLKDNAFENIPSASQLHKHARSPVSFAQERLLFIEQYEQGTSAYHIPNLFELSTDVRLDVLTRTIDYLIQRHPILRTVYFTSPEGDSYQQVIEQSFNLNKAQCRDENELLTQVSSEIERPFDLSREISLRVNLYVVEDKHYLLMVWHHIAVDGWSLDLLMQELSSVYRAFCEDRDPALPDLEINYIDYSIWQKQSLRGETLKHLEDYWQSQLSGFETLELPTDYPRPKELSYLGEDYQFELDEELTAQIRQQARLHETTVYSVLLSAFYITLATMSGQEDIIVGTPTDNRQHPQTQNLVGLLTNTLALRVSVDSNETISQLIRQVHQTVMQAKIHQELPFEQLVELLDIERDPSRNAIFDVIFDLQTVSENSRDSQQNLLRNTTLAIKNRSSAKFDLNFTFVDDNERIKTYSSYSTSVFRLSSVKRIVQMFQLILESLVNNPQQYIREINLLSLKEAQRVLDFSRGEQRDYSVHNSLIEAFEKQVDETPDAIALQCGVNGMSYLQLDNKSSQLANYLNNKLNTENKNRQTDTFIGIYLDRHVETVVAILAVLKIGAAYVPISPEYPDVRTRFILNDIQTPLILTESQYFEKVNSLASTLKAPSFVINLNDKAVSDFHSKAPLKTKSKANDLAYVIYTSGTTGNPKGVMIEQHSVINLIKHNEEFYQIKPGEVVFWIANYVFDTSVEQIFLALLTGHKLHIVSEGEKQSLVRLQKSLLNSQATHIDAPASLLTHLELENIKSLKRIVSGGEETPPSLYTLLKDKLINEYGPTETCVASHQFQCKDLPRNITKVPIGKPIANTESYVVNKNLQLVPVSVPGELLIGGVGVARGYLNQDELNSKLFINNPFCEDKSSAKFQNRLYKTGDIARWLPDGNLEFLGRKDTQVKIRGFRIELSEIDSALLNSKMVKSSLVSTQQDTNNDNRIVAHIVLENHVSPEQADELLNKSLSSVLPEYMIPSAYSYIDEIPLTANGKANFNALPKVKFVDSAIHIPAESDTQKQISKIWQELFNAESEVSIDADFFKIGGHSLLATRLASKISMVFAVELLLKDIFHLKTIRLIAEKIDQLIAAGVTQTEQRVNVFHQDKAFEMEEFEL